MVVVKYALKVKLVEIHAFQIAIIVTPHLGVHAMASEDNGYNETKYQHINVRINMYSIFLF